MERNEIIGILKKTIEKDEAIVKEKKSNINSNYTLAKLDFTIIENYEDSIKTYNIIIEELNKLQERIIKRNREN